MAEFETCDICKKRRIKHEAVIHKVEKLSKKLQPGTYATFQVTKYKILKTYNVSLCAHCASGISRKIFIYSGLSLLTIFAFLLSLYLISLIIPFNNFLKDFAKPLGAVTLTLMFAFLISGARRLYLYFNPEVQTTHADEIARMHVYRNQDEAKWSSQFISGRDTY